MGTEQRLRMTDRQWREARKRLITASDAAAACGLDPRKSELELYLEKTGELSPKDENLPMKLGKMLESTVARLYTQQTGIKVRRPPERLMVSAEHPFIGASLDRISKAGDRNVQIKTAFSPVGFGEQGTDEVPDAVIIQVTVEMMVARLPLTDIPVLFGNRAFRVYTVHFVPGMAETLAERLNEFWQRVQRCEPPQPDFSNAHTLEILRRMYGVTERVLELPPATQSVLEELEQAKAALTEGKRRKEALEGQVLSEMKDASLARCGEYLLTRKTVARKGYAVSDTTYTDFRIKRRGTDGGKQTD